MNIFIAPQQNQQSAYNQQNQQSAYNQQNQQNAYNQQNQQTQQHHEQLPQISNALQKPSPFYPNPQLQNQIKLQQTVIYMEVDLEGWK